MVGCGRRQVLGATGVVASGVLLGGCGSDAIDTAADGDPTAAGEAGEAISRIAETADVPVGGGTVVESARIVVTQPTEGEFKAFSAVCTHQGCLVTDVRDDGIVCPCHGSRFDLSTGEVLAGPARSGLEEKRVSVTDGGIDLG